MGGPDAEAVPRASNVPPMVTEAPDAKSVPERVTAVPPAGGPAVGRIEKTMRWENSDVLPSASVAVAVR